LVNGVHLHIPEEKIGVSYVDAGQEALRQDQEGGFEVLVYLLGYRNLGGKRYQERILLKMDGTQVDGSITVALVTEYHQNLFELIRLPVTNELGVVKNKDIILKDSPPFCAGQIYSGHLEMVQLLLVELFILAHELAQFFC
jgi:hypothetical protein